MSLLLLLKCKDIKQQPYIERYTHKHKNYRILQLLQYIIALEKRIDIWYQRFKVINMKVTDLDILTGLGSFLNKQFICLEECQQLI